MSRSATRYRPAAANARSLRSVESAEFRRLTIPHDDAVRSHRPGFPFPSPVSVPAASVPAVRVAGNGHGIRVGRPRAHTRCADSGAGNRPP
ncbi:hypothetical protein GCM10027610_025700 [Dactylosporangium cerinum]